MIDTPIPRWASRIVLLGWAWGLVSATVIFAMLVWKGVVGWLREKGGW